MSQQIIQNEEHYQKVIEPIFRAREFVWIGTADIKDMHVQFQAGKHSFLAVLDQLIRRKVEVRLLHAKEPGPNFRKSFDKFPGLWNALERQLCPRVHFKIIVIDGKLAYTGSANLTGAGLGMKSKKKRNFELGLLTDEPAMVAQIMDAFDEVWMGNFCKDCGRRIYCGDPII